MKLLAVYDEPDKTMLVLELIQVLELCLGRPSSTPKASSSACRCSSHAGLLLTADKTMPVLELISSLGIPPPSPPPSPRHSTDVAFTRTL